VSTSVSKVFCRNAIASMLVIAGAGFAFAADAPANHPAPSKEMREKMATLHEQMAACLRSDKPMADCRTEMMKNCQSMMGDQGCPMMGMGKGMHDHMMKEHAADSADHP
jgi:hypothetical protein